MTAMAQGKRRLGVFKRKRLIELAADGLTPLQCAERLLVNPTTVRFELRQPDTRAEIDALRLERLDVAQQKLSILANSAVTVVASTLLGGDSGNHSRLRFDAALEVMDRIGLGRVSTVNGKVDVSSKVEALVRTEHRALIEVLRRELPDDLFDQIITVVAGDTGDHQLTAGNGHGNGEDHGREDRDDEDRQDDVG